MAIAAVTTLKDQAETPSFRRCPDDAADMIDREVAAPSAMTNRPHMFGSGLIASSFPAVERSQLTLPQPAQGWDRFLLMRASFRMLQAGRCG
jgi:hypothetical protein